MQVESLIELLQTTNETLTAAIVIIAASLLLYNLTNNWNNSVARTSAIVLACVTFAYITDVFLALDPAQQVYVNTLRVQWVGIAFLPAAMFHLSDALLATTGLPSRGRRKRIIRVTYIISAIFLLIAAFFDDLIVPVQSDFGSSLQSGSLLLLFILFYVLLHIIAFLNVNRARLRCLTSGTRRRMAYLQFAILTPAIGIFPYSVILNPGEEFSMGGVFLVNLGNLIVILMLIFLSYPLSFFGSEVPDRVVKTRLLEMLLRGPGTALLVLVVINFMTSVTRILGLAGDDLLPFAVVATILLWQWSIAIGTPYIERWLIYNEEDEQELAQLQNLSNNVLTREDLLQLIEATLESVCDHLRVSKAFVTISDNNNQQEIVQSVGITNEQEQVFTPDLSVGIQDSTSDLLSVKWQDFWMIPLHSNRSTNGSKAHNLIGYMGIESSAEQHTLPDETEERLQTFVRRAEQTVDNLLLQSEIYKALEGLLPQFTLTRADTAAITYRPGYDTPDTHMPSREHIFEQVRAALRHYWGGTGISRSRLADLQIVQDELDESNNIVNAIRTVLQNAIEKQRPEGERKLVSPEWTIYNILRMRFVENKKVSNVARSLAMSESDFYRKQKAAIEVLTDSIIQMERERKLL